MKKADSTESITIEKVKALGKEKSEENFDRLLELYNSELAIPIKREVVSSIGRQKNKERIYQFISERAFEKTYMEFIYQMFRTTLYHSKDERFRELSERIMEHYDNEVLRKMKYYYENKRKKPKPPEHLISKPTLLVGDSESTLSRINDGEVQLIFTSPPYYNAREYSDYTSYQVYLDKMKNVLRECSRVLEDGRFIIINVSPVITKRPGREFESVRYPIHFDFHSILQQTGFYFVDEIIWIKPESSVKDRVGGYRQTRKPLSYKPNCITESLMVYRKTAPFLLDENIKQYDFVPSEEEKNEPFDTSNCWYIAPKSNRNHPAVFPEELCRKVLKYYSYAGDVVLDPFAGSGTFGKVAQKMERIPVLCELNEQYVKGLGDEGYDVI